MILRKLQQIATRQTFLDTCEVFQNEIEPLMQEVGLLQRRAKCVYENVDKTIITFNYQEDLSFHRQYIDVFERFIFHQFFMV